MDVVFDNGTEVRVGRTIGATAPHRCINVKTDSYLLFVSNV